MHMLTEIKRFLRGIRNRHLESQYLYRSGWDMGGAMTNPWISISENSDSKSQKKDERIEKKPIEVWKEIISEEKPFLNLKDLDGQIKLVKRRLDMMLELGAQSGDEAEALKFLQARKRFVKLGTVFQWPITTFSGIDNLVKKYKLAVVDFNGYSKTVPMEAIDELEAFMKVYSQVRDDKPVLKLIIDDTPAPNEKVSRERKKDPILLASSPFGKWFHILGAWDKEVQIVDDLVYNGK